MSDKGKVVKTPRKGGYLDEKWLESVKAYLEAKSDYSYDHEDLGAVGFNNYCEFLLSAIKEAEEGSEPGKKLPKVMRVISPQYWQLLELTEVLFDKKRYKPEERK